MPPGHRLDHRDLSDAQALLQPVIAAAGGTLGAARLTQVRRDRAGRLFGRYTATVRWSDGAERTETFASVSPEVMDGLPDGVAIVGADNGAQAGVWRYPNDPFLPGLAHVASPQAAAGMLTEMGLAVRDVRVRPLVYRPGTRAVIHLRSADHAFYVKVRRPSQAPRIRAVHQQAADIVPAPRTAAWSDDLGLQVFEALPGRTLGRVLVDGGQAPSPAALGELLDSIGVIHAAALVPDRDATLAWHAQTLADVLPDAAEGAMWVARHAGGRLAAEHTIHGDFYEAQVLVAEGAVSGVLDLDCARSGHPVEDWANLVGHLQVLADVRPSAADRINAYRSRVEAAAAEFASGDELSHAVAGVLLGMATVPYFRQEKGWPDRSRRWLQFALERVRVPGRGETPVTAASRRPRAGVPASRMPSFTHDPKDR